MKTCIPELHCYGSCSQCCSPYIQSERECLTCIENSCNAVEENQTPYFLLAGIVVLIIALFVVGVMHMKRKEREVVTRRRVSRLGEGSKPLVVADDSDF